MSCSTTVLYFGAKNCKYICRLLLSLHRAWAWMALCSPSHLNATILICERITSRDEHRAPDVGNSGRHAAVLSQLPDGVGRGEPVLVAWNDPPR